MTRAEKPNPMTSIELAAALLELPEETVVVISYEGDLIALPSEGGWSEDDVVWHGWP